MEAAIGLVIACAVVGIGATVAWFWLTDPARDRPGRSARHQEIDEQIAWICFLIGVAALGLCLFLALGEP